MKIGKLLDIKLSKEEIAVNQQEASDTNLKIVDKLINVFDELRTEVLNKSQDMNYILHKNAMFISNILKEIDSEHNITVILSNCAAVTAISAIKPNILCVNVEMLVKQYEATPREIAGMCLHEFAHLHIDKLISNRYEYVYTVMYNTIETCKRKGYSLLDSYKEIYKAISNNESNYDISYIANEILIVNKLYNILDIELGRYKTIEDYGYGYLDNFNIKEDGDALSERLHATDPELKIRRLENLIYTNIVNYVTAVDKIMNLIRQSFDTDTSMCPLSTYIVNIANLYRLINSYDGTDIEIEAINSIQTKLEKVLYNHLLDIRDAKFDSIVTKELLYINKLLSDKITPPNVEFKNTYEALILCNRLMSYTSDDELVTSIINYLNNKGIVNGK